MEEKSFNSNIRMKIFSALEVNKSSSYSVPRVCTIGITKIRLLRSTLDQECRPTSLSLALKMQGSKRLLRSNDIRIPTAVHLPTDQPTHESPSIEIDLTLAFTLEYLHHLKRNGNKLQIILQRRKHYKSKAILGYKRLASATLNLNEVLKEPFSGEVSLMSTTSNSSTIKDGSCSKNTDNPDRVPYASITVSNFVSRPAQTEPTVDSLNCLNGKGKAGNRKQRSLSDIEFLGTGQHAPVVLCASNSQSHHQGLANASSRISATAGGKGVQKREKMDENSDVSAGYSTSDHGSESEPLPDCDMGTDTSCSKNDDRTGRNRNRKHLPKNIKMKLIGLLKKLKISEDDLAVLGEGVTDPASCLNAVATSSTTTAANVKSERREELERRLMQALRIGSDRHYLNHFYGTESIAAANSVTMTQRYRSSPRWSRTELTRIFHQQQRGSSGTDKGTEATIGSTHNTGGSLNDNFDEDDEDDDDILGTCSLCFEPTSVHQDTSDFGVGDVGFEGIYDSISDDDVDDNDSSGSDVNRMDNFSMTSVRKPGLRPFFDNASSLTHLISPNYHDERGGVEGANDASLGVTSAAQTIDKNIGKPVNSGSGGAGNKFLRAHRAVSKRVMGGSGGGGTTKRVPKPLLAAPSSDHSSQYKNAASEDLSGTEGKSSNSPKVRCKKVSTNLDLFIKRLTAASSTTNQLRMVKRRTLRSGRLRVVAHQTSTSTLTAAPFAVASPNNTKAGISSNAKSNPEPGPPNVPDPGFKLDGNMVGTTDTAIAQDSKPAEGKRNRGNASSIAQKLTKVRNKAIRVGKRKPSQTDNTTMADTPESDYSQREAKTDTEVSSDPLISTTPSCTDKSYQTVLTDPGQVASSSGKKLIKKKKRGSRDNVALPSGVGEIDKGDVTNGKSSCVSRGTDVAARNRWEFRDASLCPERHFNHTLTKSNVTSQHITEFLEKESSKGYVLIDNSLHSQKVMVKKLRERSFPTLLVAFPNDIASFFATLANKICKSLHSNANYATERHSDNTIIKVACVGTDETFGSFLRTYVECFAEKASEAQNFVSFVLIPFPLEPGTSSSIGDCIGALDPTFHDYFVGDYPSFDENGGHRSDQRAWEEFAVETEMELFLNRATDYLEHASRFVALPLGEIMLSCTDRNPLYEGSPQTFLPFLHEVKVILKEPSQPLNSFIKSSFGTRVHNKRPGLLMDHPVSQSLDEELVLNYSSSPCSLFDEGKCSPSISSPRKNSHNKSSSGHSHNYIQMDYWWTTEPSSTSSLSQGTDLHAPFSDHSTTLNETVSSKPSHERDNSGGINGVITRSVSRKLTLAMGPNPSSSTPCHATLSSQNNRCTIKPGALFRYIRVTRDLTTLPLSDFSGHPVLGYGSALSSFARNATKFCDISTHIKDSLNTTPDHNKSQQNSRMASSNAPGLILKYNVKEKKQKFKGLGKKSKEPDNCDRSESHIQRLVVCSSKSIAHPLKVRVDGVEWDGVKFFQVSSQWQTHVKNFPLLLYHENRVERYEDVASGSGHHAMRRNF